MKDKKQAVKDLERSIDLVQGVLMGETYQSVGEKHSITRNRAQQIVKSVLRGSLHRSICKIDIPEDIPTKTNKIPIESIRNNKRFWETVTTVYFEKERQYISEDYD